VEQNRTRIKGYHPDQIVAGPGNSTYNLHNATLPAGFLFEGVGAGSANTNAKIDASGRDAFDIDTAGPRDGVVDAQVNLAAHADWIGTFRMIIGFIHIDGTNESTFDNNGVSVLEGASGTIDTNVSGKGTIELIRNNAANGSLKFGPHATVGAGQTVVMEQGTNSTLTIDDPRTFHGTVDIGVTNSSAADSADINLKLPLADSYSFKNDLLSFFNAHNHPIASLHLEADVPFAVTKSLSTGEVQIYTAYDTSHQTSGTVALTQVA
jgi:hypothetical protein